MWPGWPGVAWQHQRGNIISRKISSLKRKERKHNEVRRTWDLEQDGVGCGWNRQFRGMNGQWR